MEVLALLDRLETMLNQATKVPLTGRVLIDPDEVLALLDTIRDVFPGEFQEALRLREERDQILQAARLEAEAVVRQAREAAAAAVAETAIAQEAQQKADEIVDQAKRVAREIRAGAREYADELLARAEQALGQGLDAVRAGRAELK